MIPPPHVAPTPQTQRVYVCGRAAGPVLIDGDLSKAIWRDAAWTEDFVDIEGSAKPRPRHRTRAKLLWDDAYLYVGAEMDEPHVWGTLTEHDSIVYHDNDFEVFLNPTGDNHRYYELEINALGTVFDLFLPRPYRDGGPADHDWNAAGLLKAVKVDGSLNDPRDVDRGWSVELAIPWAAFDRHGGGVPRIGDVWRLNFSRVQWDHEVVDGRYRKIPARSEHNWVWSPQGVIDMHRPEQWGYLQFAQRPGEAARADDTAPARRILHAVYYAQKAHRAAGGQWARSIDELRVDAPGVGLSTTSDGWRASVRAPDGRAVTIREDSLVTVAV
jgi:hypothetical protein